MLTDAEIKRIKNPAKRYFENDGGGLFLDVLPSGVRSWVFQYRLSGRQEKIVVGRYPAMSLRAARDERKRLEGDVLKGKSPAQEKRKGRFAHLTDPTVKDFCDTYYREQVAPRLKDPSEVLRYLNKEICPVLGKLLLKDVGVLDCQRLIYAKRDKGKIISALRVRACLKQLFDYGLELRLITSNPAAQCSTRYIGRIKKRTRALSPSEIRSVLRTLDDSDIQQSFKLALRITLLTLTRKSELRLAEWKHIDFEAGQWVIPPENTKTNTEHVVYLSAQVAELFRELQVLACGSPYVLPGKSSIHKPTHENTLNGALDRVSFDMPAFVIHDFRRTASTILHGNHFQPDVIETALGHKIPGMRGVYNVAPYAPERKKMLQWWGDYVESLLNESKVVVGNFGT
jgi:integrase